MLLKLLLVAVAALLLLGGKRRIGSLARGITSLPSSFREGKGRSEDPAAYAKEIRGSARDVDHD